MKVLEFPETTTEQMRWLENEMCGVEFHRIIAEFSAIVQPENRSATEIAADLSTADLSTTDLSDAQRAAVCQRGLRALDEQQFRNLLTNPTALANLQSFVLEHGGTYWSSVGRTEAASAGMSQRLSKTLNAVLDQSTSDEEEDAAKQVVPSTQQSAWANNVAWAALSSIATAAAVLIMVNANKAPSAGMQLPRPNVEVASTDTVAPQTPQTLPTITGWGFAKFASAIDQDTPEAANKNEIEIETERRKNRSVYLSALAKAAEAWSAKRPETPAALSKRLGEFRMGCSAIMLSEHPLPAADQTWLKENCTRWAKAIDRQLASLESGSTVDTVRQQTDSVAVRIAAALRGRADTPLNDKT